MFQLMLNVLFFIVFIYGICIRFLTLVFPQSGQKAWKNIEYVLTKMDILNYNVKPYSTFGKMINIVDDLKQHEKEDQIYHFLKQIIRFSNETTLERYLQSAYNVGQLSASLIIKIFS